MYQFELIAWKDGKSIRFEKCQNDDEMTELLDKWMSEAESLGNMDQIFVDFVTSDGRLNQRLSYSFYNEVWQKPNKFFIGEDVPC